MLPRPGAVTSEESHLRLLEAYLREKLPDYGWQVLHRACGSHTITEIADWTASDTCYYADITGGIAVVQAGIVDGAPRPVNRRVRSMIGKLPSALRARVIHFLHHNRARILGGGLGSVITPLERFGKTVNSIMDRVCNTYEHVFVINICPTNSRTEQHSPGLTRNITDYNEVWHRAQKKHPDKLCLVDVHTFISSQPDIGRWILEVGTHITPATHRWIANKIIRVLEQRWQSDASPLP